MPKFQKPSMRDVKHLFMPDADIEESTAETSGNFDLDEVVPFLERLGEQPGVSLNVGRLLFSGEMIADIPHNETRTFENIGHVDGKLQILTIEAFMDDLDAPDLTFFGTERLIGIIDAMLVERDPQDETEQTDLFE